MCLCFFRLAAIPSSLKTDEFPFNSNQRVVIDFWFNSNQLANATHVNQFGWNRIGTMRRVIFPEVFFFSLSNRSSSPFWVAQVELTKEENIRRRVSPWLLCAFIGVQKCFSYVFFVENSIDIVRQWLARKSCSHRTPESNIDKRSPDVHNRKSTSHSQLVFLSLEYSGLRMLITDQNTKIKALESPEKTKQATKTVWN